MANQYKNYIVYFGDTLIDLRSDTVTAETLLEGYTAHDASGALITGTYVPTSSAITVITTPDSHGGVIKEIVAVDISRDTVTAATLLSGYTAHDRQGNAITGTYIPSGSSIQANKTVSPSETLQEVTPDSGYDALAKVTVSAISSTYVGSGVTRKGATSYTPGTSNQTIASGTYLTGTQTILGDANLIGSNILSGVSIFGVSGTVTFVTYRTGSSAPSNSLGVDGDIYLQTS